MANGVLPRYDRPLELPADGPDSLGLDISLADLDHALETSALSEGSRQLVRGLARLADVCHFPGGGLGIDYGSLLKTAARPEFIGAHVTEVATHLQRCRTNVLFVPGMSGYPVAAMYSLAAGIPAIFLKKAKPDPEGSYPAGAFVIPSYTGEGDVVMSVDMAAARDVIRTLVERQLAEQVDDAEVTIELRVAGADDISDKATMSLAVSDSAHQVCEAAVSDVLQEWRERTNDRRSVRTSIAVATWVTPLIKSYNRPEERLVTAFGCQPFAGVAITGLRQEPAAIGVQGLGVLLLSRGQ